MVKSRLRQRNVVPDWGRKDLKLGTIRGVLRQLGIDFEDFEKK